MQYVSHFAARLADKRRRKKEIKKARKKNSDFRLFLVCCFKIVATHCYYYCRLEQAL